MEKTGENRIVVVPGANNETGADRARNAIMKIPNLRVVIGQLEIDQEITLSAFSAAKERGCTTILNPAPYQAVSASLLAATDWVIPNESEFEGFDHRAMTSNVIVTLGARGAQLRIKGQPESNISTKKVDVVDSTGAGDAFVGTFAFALASGREVRKAVELACAVASQSVTRKGAQISYPRASELAGLINA